MKAALLFFGLLLLALCAAAGALAARRGLSRAAGALGTLQPGKATRDLSTREVLADIERQLEESDYSHAYVATDTWVVRVYPSAQGGHNLAVGALVTYHPTDRDLHAALKTRLGIHQRPALRVLRGGVL